MIIINNSNNTAHTRTFIIGTASSHNTSLFYFSLRPNIWNILSFQTLLPQQTPKHSPLPLRQLKCHLPLHTILLYISSLFLFKFHVYQHFVCLVALFWVNEIEDLKIYGLAFHTISESELLDENRTINIVSSKLDLKQFLLAKTHSKFESSDLHLTFLFC